MGINVEGDIAEGYVEILSQGLREFIADLEDNFGERRKELLEARKEKQRRINAGEMLAFREDTRHIREDNSWKVAEIPENLRDRRVEITGPAEPKMIINALNSNAKVFMADIEDSLSPTWHRIMEAQLALKKAARGVLTYTSPEGKEYKLTHADDMSKEPTILMVRPRGWHLEEKNCTHNGIPISASLFDFGTFFFHNAANMAKLKTGPSFYLPKLESYEEAILWRDVISFSEEAMGIKHGTTKVTILIETIDAAFQMEEILYAMKDYCIGLNCGRWDYIFSFIKRFNKRPEFVLPDRAQITMDTHFLRSYSQLLIKTCHKRGAFAMGGMAAQIPVKDDEEANEKAFAAVRADKEREANAGHDGTWVAHPALIPVAMEVFDRIMPNDNQIDRLGEDIEVTEKDLLDISDLASGTITAEGLYNNASVAIQYTANWLNGSGCIPINNLMEDAATAEIARAQLWQWAHHDAGKISETGENITVEMVEKTISQALSDIETTLAEQNEKNMSTESDSAGSSISRTTPPYSKAAAIITSLVKDDEFKDFLTIAAYEKLE